MICRKKLDGKTIELQNKVKYWTELTSEDDINIPQVIYSTNKKNMYKNSLYFQN